MKGHSFKWSSIILLAIISICTFGGCKKKQKKQSQVKKVSIQDTVNAPKNLPDFIRAEIQNDPVSSGALKFLKDTQELGSLALFVGLSSPRFINSIDEGKKEERFPNRGEDPLSIIARSRKFIKSMKKRKIRFNRRGYQVFFAGVFMAKFLPNFPSLCQKKREKNCYTPTSHKKLINFSKDYGALAFAAAKLLDPDLEVYSTSPTINILIAGILSSIRRQVNLAARLSECTKSYAFSREIWWDDHRECPQIMSLCVKNGRVKKTKIYGGLVTAHNFVWSYHGDSRTASSCTEKVKSCRAQSQVASKIAWLLIHAARQLKPMSKLYIGDRSAAVKKFNSAALKIFNHSKKLSVYKAYNLIGSLKKVKKIISSDVFSETHFFMLFHFGVNPFFPLVYSDMAGTPSDFCEKFFGHNP